MRFFWLIGLLVMALALSGCTKQSREAAVNSALQTAQSETESATEQLATSLPSLMPSELIPAGSTLRESTEVADGYQQALTVAQSIDELLAFYQELDGWSQVTQFETQNSQSVSIERADQRALVTITPHGNRSTVLITGSTVKE